MPDVAFVELPPKKPVKVRELRARSIQVHLTLLVEDCDIATGEVNSMRSTEARDCLTVSIVQLLLGIRNDDIEEKDNLRPPPTTITLGAMVCVMKRKDEEWVVVRMEDEKKLEEWRGYKSLKQVEWERNAPRT